MALGPLRLRHGEQVEAINAPMERTLLALLLVKGGQLATSAWLIDHLWPERAPRQAQNTLQTYVSHLRPRLEPERQPGQAWQVLRRESSGYLLEVAASDVRRFRALVDEGTSHLRAGHATPACETLTEALSLWRSDEAFADVTSPPPVQDLAAELALLRSQAIKAWCQAHLDGGSPEQALAELTVQRAQHPFDEEVARLSMLALHACGRTSDALRVYEEIARHLREELGTDPGRPLWEVHGQLLATTHENTAAPGRPSVLAEASIPVEPAGGETTDTALPAVRAGRRRFAALAGLVAVVVLLAVGSVWLNTGGQDDLMGADQDEVYATHDLDLVIGRLYDLDVPSGATALLPRGPELGTPASTRGDLYREEAENRIAGWPSRADVTGYNTFEPTGAASEAMDCRTASDTQEGHADVATLQKGDKFCVHTHEGRWALVIVTALPSVPTAALSVRAIVLNH